MWTEKLGKITRLEKHFPVCVQMLPVFSAAVKARANQVAQAAARVQRVQVMRRRGSVGSWTSTCPLTVLTSGSDLLPGTHRVPLDGDDDGDEAVAAAHRLH